MSCVRACAAPLCVLLRVRLTLDTQMAAIRPAATVLLASLAPAPIVCTSSFSPFSSRPSYLLKGSKTKLQAANG